MIILLSGLDVNLKLLEAPRFSFRIPLWIANNAATEQWFAESCTRSDSASGRKPSNPPWLWRAENLFGERLIPVAPLPMTSDDLGDQVVGVNSSDGRHPLTDHDDTKNAHINIDGYSLAIQDAGELGSIYPHPDYDWTGSDVTIIAQNVAYLLHRSNLRAVSEVFNSLFDSDDKSYRKSSSPCIYLPGCHSSHIEAALLHIYPTHPGITVFNSPEQWQLIYDFAFTFKFDSLWIAASQHLGKDMDPMDRIRIGRRRGWAGVLRKGLEDFSRSSQRAPSPDSEDAKLIGYDGLRTIMETRLQHSLSLHIPVPNIDASQKETTDTAHEETDMVLRPIFSPLETIFNVNHSDVSSDSITMVDWSPLTSSTAAHRSVFISGLFHITSPISELHEDPEERCGGGRSIIKKSTPRMVEIEDLTAAALEQKPPPPSTSIRATDSSVLSPAAFAISTAVRPLTENTTIGAFPKGPPAEEPKIISAQRTDPSFSRENQDSVRTGANLPAPSRSGSDSEVAGEAAAERTPETANPATVIPTEHRVSHPSSPPQPSPPVGGIVGSAEPLHKPTPTVSLVVAPVPAKVELGTPADENNGIVRSSPVDVSGSMSLLPQSTPKISAVLTSNTAEGMESSFGIEIDDAVRSGDILRSPSRFGRDSEVARETAVERTPETANRATVISTKHRVSLTSSLPASSPPARGLLRNAKPLRSSASAVPLAVNVVPAKVKLGKPVDKNSSIVRPSRVDAGRSMSDLPQSIPKTPVTPPVLASPSAEVPIDVNATGCTPSTQLIASASGEAQTSHPVPGDAAFQVNSAHSSVLMVLEKPVPKNTQDHADARGSISELLPIVIVAGDGETVLAAGPIPLLAETIPLPLSPIGGTSPSIKDTLGGRQELTAAVLEVKSESIAAVTSTLDPSTAHLPTSTALENSARHESHTSSARSPIHEEPTSENGPQIAISPVAIESQQGNLVDTEDQGRRAKNSEIGQEKSNIQDGNHSSVEELTPKQQRLNAKLKKEHEEAERVKNEMVAERIRKERRLAKRARREAERVKNETEQAEIRK